MLPFIWIRKITKNVHTQHCDNVDENKGIKKKK